MIEHSPRLLSLSLLAVACASLLLCGCRTHHNVVVGGFPGWIAEGARLESEPPPRKPDAALIHHPEESGAVEFTVFTDRRTYPAPPSARQSPYAPDPLERGRGERLRRVVR